MLNEKEFFYYLNREYRKLSEIFKDIKFKDKDYEKFILAYWEDTKYFYSKKEYVKAFELIMYIWGWLDCLINEKKIEIKEDYLKWFKLIKDF